MGTFLSLCLVGAAFATLLWLQDLTRRWSEPVDFLFVIASLAAVWAVNAFEERDRLANPYAFLFTAWFAAFVPGFVLALIDWSGDPTLLRLALLLLSAIGRTFSLLAQVGWCFIPALYAGVSLCRAKHRVRPWTDLWLWSLLTTLLAWAWMLFAPPLGTGEPLPEQLLVLYPASAAFGVLIGWRFAKTGFPLAR